MKFIPFYLFLLALGLGACSQSVEVDNPSTQILKFNIGENKIELEPGETKSISVSKGQQVIEIKDAQDSLWLQTTASIQEEGLIAPPGNWYLIWTDLYGDQTDRKSILSEKEIVLDSIKYSIDVLFVDSIGGFLPKKWDYSLIQSFPETLPLRGDQKSEKKSKIFKIENFKEAYEKRVHR